MAKQTRNVRLSRTSEGYLEVPPIRFEDLIYDFSDMFLSDNPRFNPLTFKIACGVDMEMAK